MALKNVETKLEPDGSGPHKTQPMGKRTESGEHFCPLKSTLTGGWHGRHSVQVSSLCLHSYILLDLGQLDVDKSLAWT